MPTNVTFNGNTYTLPQPGDNYGWGSDVTSFLASVAGAALAKSGGTFALDAEVDVVVSYGRKSVYFKSRGIASTAGVLRLANAEDISWRNAANTGNLALTVNE